MHVDWAEFWVIVAFMFLCIQIGRLDERRSQKRKKEHIVDLQEVFTNSWKCEHPGCIFKVESLDPKDVARIAFLHRYTKNYGGHGA